MDEFFEDHDDDQEKKNLIPRSPKSIEEALSPTRYRVVHLDNDNFEYADSDDSDNSSEIVSVKSSKHQVTTDYWKGFLWVAISSALFSTGSLFTKFSVARGVHPFKALSIRGVVQIFLSIILLSFQKINPLRLGEKELGKKTFMLTLHGVMATFGVGGFFFGLSELDISDATVLYFTSLLWTVILGVIWLKEPLKISTILALLLGTSGAVITARPPFLFRQDEGSSYPITGVLATLGAAACIGVSFVSVRRIQQLGIHSQITVFYNGIFAALISPYLTIFTESEGSPMSSATFILVSSLGLWTFLGQLCMNYGFKFAPVGSASLVRNLDVVFSFVFDILLFGKRPGIGNDIGACMIVLCSVVLVVGRKLSN